MQNQFVVLRAAPVFFLMVSFPDGLVPAETFVDPTTFVDFELATTAAESFVREEKATKVVIYSLSQSGMLDRRKTVLV